MFVLVLSTQTSAIELTCRYRPNTEWWAINSVYFCDLKFDIENQKPNDVVTAINGNHLHEQSNSDVVGFRAENKTLHYFPKGLDKYFKAEKIEFIAIWSTGLKEIHQNDLLPFKNLRILSLWNTDLQVIEHDLLKFNPAIEYIGLGKNKIAFVDGNVFGHLKQLHTFHIDGNPCISRQVVNSKIEVLDLIDEIKMKCQDNNVIPAGSDFGLDVRVGETVA